MALDRTVDITLRRLLCIRIHTRCAAAGAQAHKKEQRKNDHVFFITYSTPYVMTASETVRYRNYLIPVTVRVPSSSLYSILASVV